MKHYETMCVIPGTLSEEETAPIMEKVKSIISSEGGEEISIEEKGKSRLTYPMKHIRYGYFYIVQFQSEPSTVSSIENKLGLIPELLRHLINNFDPKRRADNEASLQNLQKRKAMDFSKPQEAIKEEVVEEKVKESVLEMEEVKEVIEEKKTEEPVEEAPAKEEKREKVDMEEIGKKLDALLDGDLGNV
ncbi:MAG: 30S ribosomal protein S6 [Candidatus Magasanikbacteria bacterium]